MGGSRRLVLNYNVCLKALIRLFLWSAKLCSEKMALFLGIMLVNSWLSSQGHRLCVRVHFVEYDSYFVKSSVPCPFLLFLIKHSSSAVSNSHFTFSRPTILASRAYSLVPYPATSIEILIQSTRFFLNFTYPTKNPIIWKQWFRWLHKKSSQKKRKYWSFLFLLLCMRSIRKMYEKLPKDIRPYVWIRW